MANVQMPKAPKAPTAPKAPKLDPKAAAKAGDSVKKKFSKKKLLLILLPVLLLILAGVALLLWMRMQGPGPSATVQEGIDAAFIGDEERFKALFTADSREALESAWGGADIGTGATRGSWQTMMRGLLTPDELKPDILGEEIAEDGESAKVDVDFDGTKRTIHLVKVDDQWLIDVNLGIDPTLIRLPEEVMTDEIAEEFSASDPENELWWEEREAAKEKAKAEAEGGCLGCVVVAGGGGGGGRVPLHGALWFGALCALGLARRRARARGAGG